MIYSIIRFAIKYRTALAIIAGLFALWGAYAYAKAQGVKECQADYEAALWKAQEESQKQLRKVKESYDKDKRALLAAEDSGYGVGPLTSNVLSGLRNRGDRE